MSIPRIPALDLSALSWWIGSDIVMQLTLLSKTPLSAPFSGMIIGAPAWWIQTLACTQSESVLHQLCRLDNPERFQSSIIAGQWSQLTGIELGPEVRVCKCSFREGEWKASPEFAKEVIRTYAWKVMTVPQRQNNVNTPLDQNKMKLIICLIIHFIIFFASASTFIWRWLNLRSEIGLSADIQALCVLILTITNAVGSVITWYEWQKFAGWLDVNKQLFPDERKENQVGIWSGYTDVVSTDVVVVLGTTDHRKLPLQKLYEGNTSTKSWCMLGLAINAIFGLIFGIGGTLSEEGSLLLIYALHGILQALIVIISWRSLEGILKDVDVTNRARLKSESSA